MRDEDMDNRTATASSHHDTGLYPILFYMFKKFAGLMILLMLTGGNEAAMKGIITLWVFADLAKRYLSGASLEV